MAFIPYGKQSISEADIQSVIDVLRSDFLTQGPAVPAFEKAIQKYCNVKNAVATNSATSALHLACLALGVKQGSVVWTSPITFVASANCALYCGAKVDFVDINPKTYNLCANRLEEKLILAKKSNKLPDVVIPVHFAGQSCDMKHIYELSSKYGFKIIEDASHAIGGKYLDKPIGSCEYSDITVFSFHPVKIITTAEGGVATTNQPDIADKMNMLRSHGITRDAKLMNKKSGGWYYEQLSLGFNYRMTDIQAALGVSQMSRLNDFVKRRHQLKARYDELLKELPVITPYQTANSYSALHLYPIQLEVDLIKKTHKQVFQALRDSNIGVNLHYIPVHTQPYYQKMGFNLGDFPAAEEYYSRAISIPMFYDLSNEMQSYVVDTIKRVVL